MSRSRAFHGKDDRPSFDDDELPSASYFEPPDEARRHQQRSERPPQSLASDVEREHDSDDWHVTDDWPEQVPIALDEIEAIEAFLGQILDELLK